MAVNFNKLREVAYTQREKQGKATEEEKSFLARNALDQAAKDTGKSAALPSSADLYRQADLTGAAKGQGAQTLPSGAPVVRPAVQKSIDDYKAIDKAAETLAKHGELTEKDAETLGKARNAVMADASAYDAVAAEQTPKMFADRVDKLAEKPKSIASHGMYRISRPAESIAGVDGAKASFSEKTAANADFEKRYAKAYADFAKGKVSADDLAVLGREKNKLSKDNNAFLRQKTKEFDAAVEKAYNSAFTRNYRMDKEISGNLPKGYDGTAADKEAVQIREQYERLFERFLQGDVSEKELAELNGKAIEVSKRNDTYWSSTDGIIEYGKRLQNKRDVLKKELNKAQKRLDDARNELSSVATDVHPYDRSPNSRSYNAYLEAYKTVAKAESEQKMASEAYQAANYNVNLNQLQHEYTLYKHEYENALRFNKDSPIMKMHFGYDPKSISEINALLQENYFDGSNGANQYESLYYNGSPEEKQIFSFLLEKKGKNEAEEFVSLIQPLLDLRIAQKKAKEYDKANLLGKLGIGSTTQIAGGLSDFGMGAVGTVKGLLGDDSYTFPATAQSVASAVRNEEKGVIAGAAMDIIRSTANMAPSIALGKITAAAGFIKAAPVIQSLAFGASAGGNSYLQAINDGKDAGEAFLYGAVSGASEVLLERVLGGITGFGTSGASKLLETSAGKTVRRRIADLLSQNVSSVSDRLRVQAISAAGRFISNGVSEGIEEFSQELLDPIFRNMIFAEENEVFTEENFKDALYAGAIGFFNSALLNLPNEYMQSGALRNLLRGQASDADINTVLSSPELIRDVERIFSYQFNMTTDEGGFRFSDNDTVNRTFLEMFNRGAAMGTKNSDAVRNVAGEAGFTDNSDGNASAADVTAAVAESINAAAGSKTDEAASEIREKTGAERNAAINSEAGKRVDEIIKEQGGKTTEEIFDGLRKAAQKQRAVDEEYLPIASSRGELARFVDGRIGKEVWVDGEKRTVKGISKGAIQTVKENGTVITDTLAGGKLTYNKHGFSVTGKNGTVHEFYFGSDVGIKAEKSQAEEAQKAEQVEKDLAETSSIELKKPFPSYSEDKQKTIKEFVEYRDGRIGKYVDDILSGNQNAKNKLYLDTISDRAADDIQKVTGIDTHGFETVLFRNIVQHIEKRHGKNGLQDQSMKHIEDWERIQYVLNNYDTIQFAGSSSAFTITKNNGQQKSAPTVIYSKAINGTFYVVEAVPDTKNKTVNIVTAYTQQKGQNGSRDVQSPTVTPETTPVTDAPSAVDISLRENDVGNVGKNVNVLQNQADSAALTLDMSKVKSADNNVSGTEMIRFLKAQLDNYFKHGGTDSSLLNEKTPERQLETMKKLFGFISEKPSWLTDKDFANYEALIAISNERNSEKVDISATKASPIPVNVSEVKADLIGKFKGLFGNDEQVSNLYNKFADHVLKLAKEEERVPESKIITFVNAVLDSMIAENGSIDVKKYNELRRYVWKTPITVSKTVRGDFADWNEFKSKAYKYMRFINFEGNSKHKGKRSIDTMWGELCEEFPGWFKENVTNDADQIRALYNVLSSLNKNVSSMNEVISADEKKQIVENVSDYVEKALNNYRLIQLGKGNKTPVNFTEMVEADVSNYFREHSGEEILVNGEKMKINGVKGDAISVLRENGSEARVHLTRTNTEFNANGFTVTFENGRKAVFVFPEYNSQEYLSDVEIRRELGLLSDEELAKEEVGDIEDDGISWEEVFPDTTIYENKEDSPGSDLTAEKVPLGLHEEESSDNSIPHNDENVNAEAPTSETVSRSEQSPTQPQETIEESTRQTEPDSMEPSESKSGSDAVSDNNNSDKEAKNNALKAAREVIENIKRTAQSPKEALKSLKESGTYAGTDENTIHAVSELAKAFGVRILLFDGNGKTDIDGFYDRKSNTIYLNAGNHAKPIQATVRHELIHFLAQANKGAFEAFRDFVVGRYAETYGKDALNTWLDNKKAEYEAAGMELDKNGAKEELCADLAMDMLTDLETVKGFAKENRSAARRILDALRRFIDKIRVLLGLEPKYSAGKANALETLAKTGSTVKVTDGKVERSHASFKNDTLPAALKVKDLYAAEQLLYKALTSAEIRNSNANSDGIRFSGETDSDTDIITVKDIDNLRSIGRKSVNDFTSEDIKKAEPFARRYFKELGVKSPFFRAWFGDWRAHDTSEVKVVSQKSAERGKVKNTDTGWDIQVSAKVFNETKAHTHNKNVTARPFLDYINGIAENAILLDSYAIPADKVKSPNSAMMHSLYAIADMGNGRELVKLYVEELNDVNSDGTIKRAYQLQNIKNQQLNAKGSEINFLAQSTTADVYTIAQLFDLVKAYDKDFHAKDANPALLDADGKPLVVYHGTKDSFTEFILQKEPKFGRTLGDGFYFTSDYTKAHQYANGRFSKGQDRGGIVMPVYLNMRNPYIIKADADRTTWGREYRNGDYDGIIDEKYNTYYVESPTQIKSATDNIGTFDGANPDIRYSKSGKKVDKIGSEEYNNRIGKDEEDARGWYDFRRVQEEARREFAKSDKEHKRNTRNNEKLQTLLRGILSRELVNRGINASHANEFLAESKKNGTKFRLFGNVDGNTFHDVFEVARAFTRNGELVDLHEVKSSDDGIGYEDCTNYLSDDGLSGFSITPKGDLISVFNANASKPGFLDAISEFVKQEATTLDCYASPNQNLMEMYKKKFGFKVASVMDYNMEYDHDGIAKNHEMPQVAFMVNTNEDVKTKPFTKDQYDEAVAYRDSFIDKNTGDGSDGHMKTSEKESSDVLFSYEALTAKPDMPLTDIDTDIPRDENGKVIRKDVADLAIQTVRDSGNKKNTDVDVYVHVDDTNSDLKVNVASVRHSLTRKPDLNAIAALNIVGLAKNAVLVNELSPRGNSNGGNIYLSVGKDSDSNLYFVRMITDKRGHSIEEIETVYAISTKKESVAHYRQGYGNESSFAFTDSTISIADLLDFVKNHFSDILPESVLQHYGISRKESAVSDSVMYSLNTDKDSVQTIPKGEDPARDVDVRAFDEHGGKVSEGIRTVAEASVTPDSYVRPLLEDVAKGKYSHEIKTNKGAMARAENVIARDGYQETAERYLKDFEDGRSFGKDDIAVLQTLYAGAAQHMDYLSETDGDVTLAEKLVVAMVQTATNAGQALQAQRLLKKLSPEGTLYAYEKSVNHINRAIERSAGEWDGENDTRVKESGKGFFKQLVDSAQNGYYSPKQAPVEIDPKLKKKLLNAKNPHEMDKVCEEIKNDVAKQILSTVPDKLRAWRYMSMLTNPRTHVRNFVGNALFGVAVQTRDIIGTIAERTIIHDKSKRTKAIALTPKQHSEYKAIAKHAARFYDEHEAFVKGESNRYDMTTSNIEAAKKPFKNRFLGAILNAIYEFNSNLLEKADLWFIKGHFVRQFTHALMAKGYTAEQLKNGEVPAEVLQKIAEYASNEAQKATFRDANAAATMLNRIENMNRVTKVAVSAIMPFKKTPMNILRRGIEYSPVSLITGVYKTISQNVQKSKGRIKSVDTAGIINDFSQGLTGSMIFVLGVWLLSEGILKAGDDGDDKKQNLEEAMGKQSYSIEIGGESFTLDWAAPLCMPLFAGAEFAKALQEKEISPLQVLLRMSDPVLETSMMSGVLDFLSSGKYADGDSGILQRMVQSAISSYVLQFFPTAMGAAARVMDEYESRTTRTDKKGDAAFWERLGRQIINKIPYARQVFNKPYVDLFGKQEKKEKPIDYALSVVKNTVIPGYITSVSGTKSEKILYEVMEESKETKFIPGFVTKFNVNKKPHTLSQEEYYNYHVMRGEWYETYLPEVASEEWFTDLEADEQAIVLESFKDIADDLTKKRVIPEYDLRLKRSKYLYRMLYGDEPVSGQEAVNVVKQIFHGIALSELAKKQAAEERTKLFEAEPAEEAE